MSIIRSILIANRGEIASRIIRACREMGIRSIAVYSEVDRYAPFVQEADMAVFIGSSVAVQSYLDQEKIIQAAIQSTADAVHPGYGFLSENAAFAQKCREKGIIFIGPHPEAIAAMGSKSRAKKLMQSNGIPILPGYEGDDQSVERLKLEAEKIGFPILLKAAAGGGGKGMRIVYLEAEMEKELAAAKREALHAFGEDELIIEKYIPSARHIEFQMLGDQHGNIVHLLERECTIQRRYQKIVEESPSPIMDDALRDQMGSIAVKAAKALQYENAGTVEFIYDEQTNEFYFLEVNARLQVEHPVTEEITGLDLVQIQIEIAEGKQLDINQLDVSGKGYAVEVRLYAEDPGNNFSPVTGQILHFELPKVDGLRIETAVATGSEVSVFYDPMIAKLIVWAENREEAHRKMHYVLKNMVCLGIQTNQGFLLQLFENELFRQGLYNTHFIPDHIQPQPPARTEASQISFALIAATLLGWSQREQQRMLLRGLPSGWRNNFYDYQWETWIWEGEECMVRYRFQNESFHFIAGDNSYKVLLLKVEEGKINMEIDNQHFQFYVRFLGEDYYLHHPLTGNIRLRKNSRFPQKEKPKVAGGYEAPMPSQIVKVLVEEGQEVKAGEGLIVLSSMKMENTLAAEADGVVEAVFVEENKNVEKGFLLIKLAVKESET